MKAINGVLGMLCGAGTLYLIARLGLSITRRPLMDVVATLAAIGLGVALTLLFLKSAQTSPDDEEQSEPEAAGAPDINDEQP
jgi:hypothetical protein